MHRFSLNGKKRDNSKSPKLKRFTGLRNNDFSGMRRTQLYDEDGPLFCACGVQVGGPVNRVDKNLF